MIFIDDCFSPTFFLSDKTARFKAKRVRVEMNKKISDMLRKWSVLTVSSKPLRKTYCNFILESYNETIELKKKILRVI